MVVDLVKLIRKAQENTLHQSSEMKDIFLKDAIYKAAGLSAFNLFDEVKIHLKFIHLFKTKRVLIFYFFRSISVSGLLINYCKNYLCMYISVNINYSNKAR